MTARETVVVIRELQAQLPSWGSVQLVEWRFHLRGPRCQSRFNLIERPRRCVLAMSSATAGRISTVRSERA